MNKAGVGCAGLRAFFKRVAVKNRLAVNNVFNGGPSGVSLPTLSGGHGLFHAALNCVARHPFNLR